MTIYIPEPKRIWVPPKFLLLPESIRIIRPSEDLAVIQHKLIIFERSYRLIIGHPDLPEGASHQAGDTLYTSIYEALNRQKDGQEVEIHWTSTPIDELALASLRETIIQKRRHDPLSKLDGWTI